METGQDVPAVLVKAERVGEVEVGVVCGCRRLRLALLRLVHLAIDDDDDDGDDDDDDDCPPGHRGATHAWVEDRSPWVREVSVPGPLAVQRNTALRSLCSCRPPASCPARSV